MKTCLFLSGRTTNHVEFVHFAPLFSSLLVAWFAKHTSLHQFVEDEGDVVFYKDAYGQSAVTVKYDSTSDSGVDVSADEVVEADC